MVKSIAAPVRSAVSLVVTSSSWSACDSDGLVDRAGLAEHGEYEVGDVGAWDGQAAFEVLPVGRAVSAGQWLAGELWWPDHGPVQAAAGQDVFHLRQISEDLAEPRVGDVAEHVAHEEPVAWVVF